MGQEVYGKTYFLPHFIGDEMRLVSTFNDYYDYAFDLDGEVFARIGGNTGPARSEQFHTLASAGFQVPPHGRVEDILGDYFLLEGKVVDTVVAYTDEMAHCTEGKKLVFRSSYDSFGCDPIDAELYCSAFVGDPFASPSISWRRLQIGPHVIWVEYRGSEDWRSNFGDGSCEVIGVEMNRGFHPVIRRPLFAIDFVLGREMYAVDLNFGPGIRGSGVEKILSAQQIRQAIEAAIHTSDS